MRAGRVVRDKEFPKRDGPDGLCSLKTEYEQ